MMINQRLLLPALVALAGQHAQAFTPAALGRTGYAVTPFNPLSMSMVATESDVSIEYDAAARLSYKGWCAEFGKESSDAKFETFKANYEALTVANVSAAKTARESGTDRPKDLALNEFGDMTEAEYMAMQSGGSEEPKKGALESAMEASVAQSDASSALAEAASALAEEEEKLAAKLGMDSVEELEEALDAIDGFDKDGGEIDTSDVREARVRSSYLDWCKEYGKQADESRFPTFSSNFLAMEEYAKENGREMVLNKYADCTEEEYREVTNTEAPPEPVVEEKAPEIEKVIVEAKAAVKAAVKAAAPAPVPAPNVEAPKAEPKAAVEAPKKPVAVAPKEPAAKAPPKPVSKVPPKPKQASKPEPVKEISLEEQAIADARATAEAEAAQIAKRRAIDEKAAEQELQKANEFIEKQKQLEAKRAVKAVKSPTPPPKVENVVVKSPVKSPTPPAKEEKNVFASFLGSGAKKAEPVAKTVQPVVKKPEPPVVKAPVAKKPTPPAPKKAETKDAGIFSSFFGGSTPEKSSPPPKPVEKKPVAVEVQAKVAPAPPKVSAPVPPKVSAPKKTAPKDIDLAPNALTEALNSFFGTAKPAPPVAPPAPKPAPEPVVKASSPQPQLFGFFGSPPAAKKTPAAPKPAPKPSPVRKPSPTLTIRSPPTPSPAPKPTPTPKSSGGFFSFGQSAQKPVQKTPPPVPVVSKPAAIRGSGTFSLFSSPPTTKAAPSPAPKPAAVAKKPTPSFGFFSASPKPAPKAPSPPVTPVAKKPVQGSGTFSIFGGSAPKTLTPPTPAPVAQKKASAPKKKNAFTKTKKPVNPYAKAKGSGTISISSSTPKKAAARGPGTFSISSSAPKKSVSPAPAPVPSKKVPTFSLFGGPSPSVKKPASPQPVTPKATPKKTSGFSFGGGAAPKTKVPPKPAATKPAKKSPTFNLFGGSKPSASKPAPMPQAAKPKAAPKKSSAFSFGGGGKAAAEKAAPKAAADNLPTVSKFKQNADGSISGRVRNSKSFRDGTDITTSPVKRGAKAGDVVTTSSGSKYRLE